MAAFAGMTSRIGDHENVIAKIRRLCIRADTSLRSCGRTPRKGQLINRRMP